MRSYYSHLESFKEVKPISRASAIFPVFQQPGVSSRLLFMGYWMLKRNIKELTAVVTLRSEKGEILHQNSTKIQEPKTYRIELSDLIDDACFVGSLEVEFFSDVPLVFPFPAVVVNYYGPHFSTVVHTAQRVYNDLEDMQRNSETNVPESGFNLFPGEEPFVSLINGKERVEEEKVAIKFYNSFGESLLHETSLGPLEPYETRILYLAKEVNLKSFLKNEVGSAKLKFHLNWIFPRLLVGNFQKSLPALSITHTYYDCSNATKDSDYWLPEEKRWHPAALMLPFRNPHTRLSFYPIYSPSALDFSFEIYDSQGNCLGKKENFLHLASSKFQTIELQELFPDLTQEDLAVRVIAHAERIPARIKVAIDIGERLPCNICTNLQPFNPGLESKPKTFRWMPVLADQPGASIWVMSSSPEVVFEKETEIVLTYYREKDTKTLEKKIVLPPHGFLAIRPEKDAELVKFLKGTIGWVTAVATNPYTTTYYFVEHPSGPVGGDHGF